mgnify:CR=1 FL=1
MEFLGFRVSPVQTMIAIDVPNRDRGRRVGRIRILTECGRNRPGGGGEGNGLSSWNYREYGGPGRGAVRPSPGPKSLIPVPFQRDFNSPQPEPRVEPGDRHFHDEGL